ncbi:DNA-3-methyladenine glycosylase 2 family protein [Falsarthrobacter nasiphocae]
MRFYLTSAAAHEAGFRACKRCLPEATPGSPQWDVRGDVAARAMRLIGEGIVDREGVPGLAARLGYSPRQLQRVMTAELGAGPAALARAQRAQTARALIAGTDLPMSDVAFAAGFGSVRQFNETMREVFAVAPGDLPRRTAGDRRGARQGVGAARSLGGHRGADQGAAALRSVRAAQDGGAPRGESPSSPGDAIRLTVDLPVRQPFDAPGVFEFLAPRALDGVERIDLSDPDRLVYARTLRLPGAPGAARVIAERRPVRGGAARVRGSNATPAVTAAPPSYPDSGPRAAGQPVAEWTLSADLELGALSDLPAAIARLRRLFDLDADPVAVDAALAASHPRLAEGVAATPGMRVPGAADAHEMLARAIVGQQITVGAARGHLSRVAELGPAVSFGFDGLTRLFPTAEECLAVVPDPGPKDVALEPGRPLRLPRRSIVAFRGAMAALASGDLVLDAGRDRAELARDLVALPGIGPWTAAYVTMRVLGDPDVWMRGDVALIAGAKRLGLLEADMPARTAHVELERIAADWSPWRSYAQMHLWRAVAMPAP